MVGNDFGDDFVKHIGECYGSELAGHGGLVFLVNESKESGIESWPDSLGDVGFFHHFPDFKLYQIPTRVEEVDSEPMWTRGLVFLHFQHHCLHLLKHGWPHEHVIFLFSYQLWNVSCDFLDSLIPILIIFSEDVLKVRDQISFHVLMTLQSEALRIF